MLASREWTLKGASQYLLLSVVNSKETKDEKGVTRRTGGDEGFIRRMCIVSTIPSTREGRGFVVLVELVCWRVVLALRTYIYIYTFKRSLLYCLGFAQPRTSPLRVTNCFSCLRSCFISFSARISQKRTGGEKKISLVRRFN